jgi:hypothetical protein
VAVAIATGAPMPEWADWSLAELNSTKKIQPLMGFGYTGIE